MKGGGEYLLLLPFFFLILMDQSSPHGALSPPTVSGDVAQVLESQIQNVELNIVSRRKGKASHGLCALDWLGAAYWSSRSSLTVREEGDADTHTHGKHAERRSSVELSPVAGFPGDNWLQSPGAEQI